jgi:hypothetical protein
MRAYGLYAVPYRLEDARKVQNVLQNEDKQEN